ncbi:MAG: patatin, partial [Sphingomonas sp.]
MTGFDHVALVLGGGNALGAYQAGAYAALHRHGLRIDHIAGASAGSINGGIIAGNPPERRLDRLTALWRPAPSSDFPASFWMPSSTDTTRRSLAATWSLATGRTGMFRPRGTAIWQALFGDPLPGLYDTDELQRTLEETVDYARLNDGTIRFTATAVDLERGTDIAFDTRTARVEAS